jgi:hypothetical protein
MQQRVRVTAALAIALLVVVAAWAILGPLHKTTLVQAAAPFTLTINPPNAVAVSQTAQLSGTVNPHSPGSSVDLQVKTGSSWRNYASAQLGSNSSYTFAFEQANPGFYLVRVVKPASSTRAAGSASATQVVTGSEVRLRLGTVVVNPAQLVAYSANGSNAFNLTLSASAPQVAPGNHLVMSATPLAPEGILAAVATVARAADGTQVVKATPASLSEAYSTFNVSVQNGVAVTTPKSSAAPGGATLDSAHLDAATGGPNINLSDVALQCSGPDRPKFSIQADWSRVRADFLLNIYGPVIAFDFIADPSITVSETFTGSVSCSLPGRTDLQVSIPVWDAPPIVLTIKPVLTIDATGTVTLGYVFQPSMVIGFDRGDGDNYDTHVLYLHGAPSVSGDASFSSQLGVSLEISLAGRAGITGTVGPELTGSLNGSCINVGADLAVELDANVDIFVHSWAITLWSGHFFPVQLLHYCFTSTPTPNSQTPGGKGGPGSGPPGPGNAPTGPGSPGLGPASIDIGWSASHRGWVTMTLHGYAPSTYAYGCNFGSGGDQSFSVRVTSNPETFDNGQTCYDTIPGDAVWVTVGSVRSNTITVQGSPTPTPTPTPTPPPPTSIQIGWSGAHPSWIWMTLAGFAPGEYTYSCDFGSGGDQSFQVGVTSDPETFDNGKTCYDGIPGDTLWVTIGSVRSNTITVAGSPPTPTPTPTPASIQIGWSGSHPSWIWMTVSGFTPGQYTYSCDFGSGGDQSFPVGISSNPETFDNGQTCYDGIPGDTVWVTINSTRSNTITVP